MGRPSICSEELVDEICNRLSEGESLLRICKDEHMPARRTIERWILDPRHEDFCRRYMRAITIRAERIFDELE